MNFGQFGNRPGLIRPPSFTPGGYLTPVSGQPAITADATAVSTVFYTPDQHNALPVMRAGVFDAKAFDEAALPLTGLAANNIYDLLAYADGRSVRFGWSPAWQTATAGAGARGSGLGTPELMRRDGLFVNANPILVSMAGQSRSIAVGAGTYLGSVSIGSVAGQVNCHRSYGQSRRWDVFNPYNRRPVILRVGDSTASWTYGSGTLRPSQGNTANSCAPFCGLETSLTATFNQNVSGIGGSTTTEQATCMIGIGVNSTSAASGLTGVEGLYFVSGGLFQEFPRMNPHAEVVLTSAIGSNVLTALEAAIEVASVTVTFSGTAAGMQLMASWLG